MSQNKEIDPKRLIRLYRGIHYLRIFLLGIAIASILLAASYPQWVVEKSIVISILYLTALIALICSMGLLLLRNTLFEKIQISIGHDIQTICLKDIKGESMYFLALKDNTPWRRMTVQYKRLANNKCVSIDNGKHTHTQLEKEKVASDFLIVAPIEIDLGYKELIVHPIMSEELTTTSEDITE